MALLYSAVITDICSQVGDAGEDTYATRAKDHLQAAISQLIKDGNYTEDELPGFVARAEVDFAVAVPYVDTITVAPIKIISITPKYSVAYATDPYFVKYKELTELGGIHANEEEQPTNEDVFVIKYGNTLEAIINVDASNFTPGTDKLWMFYLADPDITATATSTDLLTLFRISFIQRAKLIAIQTIKQEDELSN